MMTSITTPYRNWIKTKITNCTNALHKKGLLHRYFQQCSSPFSMQHQANLLKSQTLENLISLFALHAYLRFGFLGNQPFSTRSRCSFSSPILHKKEQPSTPSKDEPMVFCTSKEQAMQTSPATKNAGQILSEK